MANYTVISPSCKQWCKWLDNILDILSRLWYDNGEIIKDQNTKTKDE
jgi:hypothetical protein